MRSASGSRLKSLTKLLLRRCDKQSSSDKMIHTMPSSSPPTTEEERDYASELQKFLSELSQVPEREQVVSEIEGTLATAYFQAFLTRIVLQSIYGEQAVRVWHPTSKVNDVNHSKIEDTIRYEVLLE